ncbi:MAG: aromatic ring-hydroxylating dioxygenase subunit alpha [Alphaproteobacteria bacterium]|nr:aromatic ring-hydroxylating dioxygenase subunit alpha [Rhodospirillaceae bacterium]MDG2481209.1 aromatic ring-hydroxylating dioxygenase subunit alpha [Alphaproteobacteria bacterium]MBT6205514.1 aromatic ring-hydroxylating dioxygenase subunit alpha [Rhodospirillaceae bacterium]MBT6511579.1 aromatic ring-hydroxylating dioxygenase subunit alpha [Rhodospirillaceae bacterium]MBT7612100.1 aromatic ring-hydroxylating dioxygenase subunit alpha [Rhodospirillaceae bacterium]
MAAAQGPQPDVRTMLGEEALARLRADVSQGSALPNIAYTSAAWLELERRHLMWPMWMLAGFESQVRDPGDTLPVTVAGCPIVLVRQRDGELAAFHNVCRHRGAVIVTEPCRNLATLTCPYHAWVYGLDGKLRTRPHFHGGGNHDVPSDGNERANLHAVRCESWRGMVFVNIDGNARPLAEHMRPADDQLEGWEPQRLAYGGSLTFEVQANWKHIHENFIDVYHKFAIHPALCEFAPLETSNPMVPIADHLLKTEHEIAAPQEGRGKGLPPLPGLPDVLHREGRFFTMIPTCNINVWYDQIAILVAEPTGPGTTRETIHLLFAPEAMAGQFDDARQAVLNTWDGLNREDIGPLESMQRGRVSPGFDGGAFSPFWDSGTHFFARQVAELMLHHAGETP